MMTVLEQLGDQRSVVRQVDEREHERREHRSAAQHALEGRLRDHPAAPVDQLAVS